ncbi:MAG: hypothetical protein AAB909_00065, partial [Patescibacteria group bacterium]
ERLLSPADLLKEDLEALGLLPWEVDYHVVCLRIEIRDGDLVELDIEKEKRKQAIEESSRR